MYADTTFPCFQNFTSEFDDFYNSHKFITSLDSLIQSSTVSDYDLGDLFKAPEPIIQQQPLSIISSVQDTISTQQQVELTDIQNQELLSDVFYECKNLLPKEASPTTESSPLSEVINFSFPDVAKENVHPASCQIAKSMSSDSLNSMDWIQGAQVKSSFLNFSEIDVGGMRRAFSEGDIKTLSDATTSLNYYPFGQPSLITEDRMQKLSRYRTKKTKRNFGRKIKYACRKALADSQPRIRGRFAKTDESDIFKK